MSRSVPEPWLTRKEEEMETDSDEQQEALRPSSAPLKEEEMETDATSMMSDADGPVTLTALSNQLADMDLSVEDSSKEFSFTEVNSIRASPCKVVCCHFSPDGKLLASGGHDKKATLWYRDSLKLKTTLEGHSSLITDVCFSPSMPRLATSSFDKTVRFWDADNPGYTLQTFIGHSAAVMSLDFHPNKDGLVWSCDGDGEIRYWSINNGSCTRVFKGGMAQVRFQPRLGGYLAAAAENVVSILDVETGACRYSLQGNTKLVYSVCWDPSGDYLAYVSEDSVRVWTLGSGSEGECVCALSCDGIMFHSFVFHPIYPSFLVIGCYQSLELWNITENRIMTLPAHDGLLLVMISLSNCGSDVIDAPEHLISFCATSLLISDDQSFSTFRHFIRN